MFKALGHDRLTFGSSSTPPAFYPLRVDMPTYLPITLSVNSESREETLRHYVIVPRTDLLNFMKGRAER
jgi:hypothetical protein